MAGSLRAIRNAAKATAQGKNVNGYVLPDDKLQQRELAFVVYRDLGPTRSMRKLAELPARDHPDIAAAGAPSLARWARLHGWQARVKVHDNAMAKAPVQVLSAPQSRMVADPDFDQVDALLSAANQALTRALNASPAGGLSSSQFLKLPPTIRSAERGRKMLLDD
jgi:hypothetical protein